MIRLDGQRDGKRTAFARFAGDGHAAVVRLDDKLDDTQAQATAAGATGKRSVHLVETLKHFAG